MKKSEQAKAPELEDGVDMISNFPDHVLLLILSGIPSTEEVIQTSILSRRWRYLWTLVPSIDIDYARGLDPLKGLDSNGFKDFVYWVLLNKPLDLDGFRLRCADYYNMLTIRQWIHAAVMRKVKLLDLMFCPIYASEDLELPHCLVTCGSLEVLKLCLFGCRLCVPNITGFQALRVLELREVDLYRNNLVNYFLESCPLLEDLSLIDCEAYELFISSSKLKKLRIDTRKLDTDEDDDNDLDLDRGMCFLLEITCPKLEFLNLTDYVAMEFLFENLYSLKKAVIHPKGLFTMEAPSFDMFARMSHVESLSIFVCCIEQWFHPEVYTHVSLPNLRTLEITIDEINIDALILFLKCLPVLESLHLIIPRYIYNVDLWNLDEAATINILTRHLKKVEFLEFDEEKPRLVAARALLEHGNLLEVMVFSWDNEAKFHERSMEIMNEVSKFHKASSIVKLTAVINPT